MRHFIYLHIGQKVDCWKDTASNCCIVSADLSVHAFMNRTDLTLPKRIVTSSLPFTFVQYFPTPFL